MKYLKGTLITFLITMIFSVYNVNAENQIYILNNITIHPFNVEHRIKANKESDEGTQFARKTTCFDIVSNDERAVQARLYGMYSGVFATPYVDLPKGKKVSLGGIETTTISEYELYLKSKKKFVTTALFYGYWAI